MFSNNELSMLNTWVIKRWPMRLFCEDNEMRFCKTSVPNSPVNWVEIATLKKIYYKEDYFIAVCQRLPIEIWDIEHQLYNQKKGKQMDF